MSHYSVMVLSDEDTCVEELLAPFDESIEVPEYQRYSKQQLIENKRADLLRYRDGLYAEYLKNPMEYKLKNKNEGHIKYISEDFPKLLENIDDDEVIYKEAISWYEPESIDETGGILSTYNPKSKWDWYVEGGRWSGSLKLKDGGTTDSAYADEIDFSPSKEDSDYYGRVWDLVVEGVKPENDDEDFTSKYYKKESFLNKYGSKERYIEVSTAFSTYAVLTPDGEWHEPGEMGWWGVSHASDEEEKDWYDNYAKFVEMAKENNYLVTIVDCHI